MLEKFGESLTAWARRNMPDPFLFAILLTFLSLILGLLLTSHSLEKMLGFWKQGFWVFLKFSMQMCMILVTGYALASTDLVRHIIHKIADLPKNSPSAASLVCFVAVITGFINWGLGIIVGALTAREVALRAHKRGILVHYPLLGAAGYMGLAVWHGGLSGSAPLKLAERGHELQDMVGVIPVENTLFSPLNLIVSVMLMVCLPLLFRALSPSNEKDMLTIDQVIPHINSEGSEQPQIQEPSSTNLAKRLERSRLISFLTGICGVGILVVQAYRSGSFELSLNQVNFLFLFMGILLHKTPIAYVNAISDAASACSGIILQFPFYSGIMGMVKSSGLISIIVQTIQSIATPSTLSIFTFFSACLVNIFVPSGGGQWMVQGPIVLQSAQEMGVPVNKVIMAFCYGDQWTNLFQPFWALPLLGITGLRASQIMGYCITVMLIGFLVFPMTLVLFS